MNQIEQKIKELIASASAVRTHMQYSRGRIPEYETEIFADIERLRARVACDARED